MTRPEIQLSMCRWSVCQLPTSYLLSGLCLNILFKKYFDKDCYVTLFSRKGFSIGIWVDFPFQKGKKGLLSSFCKRTAWITRTKGLFVMWLSSPENSFLLVFGVKGLSKRTKWLQKGSKDSFDNFWKEQLSPLPIENPFLEKRVILQSIYLFKKD